MSEHRILTSISRSFEFADADKFQYNPNSFVEGRNYEVTPYVGTDGKFTPRWRGDVIVEYRQERDNWYVHVAFIDGCSWPMPRTWLPTGRLESREGKWYSPV